MTELEAHLRLLVRIEYNKYVRAHYEEQTDKQRVTGSGPQPLTLDEWVAREAGTD